MGNQSSSNDGFGNSYLCTSNGNSSNRKLRKTAAHSKSKAHNSTLFKTLSKILTIEKTNKNHEYNDYSNKKKMMDS